MSRRRIGAEWQDGRDVSSGAERGVMVGPAVKLVVAAVIAAGQVGSPVADYAASRLVQFPGGSLQAALEPEREPPAGSGAEFTRYVEPPQLHNGFLAGGLVAWTSVLIGALLVLEKRRMAAITIAGGGFVVGVALMFTGVL